MASIAASRKGSLVRVKAQEVAVGDIIPLRRPPGWRSEGYPVAQVCRVEHVPDGRKLVTSIWVEGKERPVIRQYGAERTYIVRRT